MWVTYGKFHADDLQISGDLVRNPVTREILWLGFL